MSIVRFPTERRHARELVTIDELAELICFSPRWIRYRLKEGMPHYRWGAKGLRFSPDDVYRWLEERYQHG